MASALLYSRYRMGISLQCCPLSLSHGGRTFGTAPQRRSLAGARVDSVEQRNIPTWGHSAIMLLAAVCRVGFA